jgi:hypothetical protein
MLRDHCSSALCGRNLPVQTESVIKAGILFGDVDLFEFCHRDGGRRSGYHYLRLAIRKFRQHEESC